MSYHNCLNKPARIYFNKKIKSSLDFAIGAGIGTTMSNQSSFEEFNNTSPNTSGLNLKIRFNKGSRSRINLTSSFNYLKYNQFLINHTGDSNAYETRFDYNSYRFSIGGKYIVTNLGESLKLSIHLEAGSGFSTIKNQKRIIDEISGDNIFIRSETFEIGKIEPFGSISLIADYSLGSNALFIEINNSVAFGKIEDNRSEKSSFQMNNLAIMAGFKLPFN